ncbi:Interferon-induced protein 44 [Exaiptasia diaphana]|nr:Interferon-induced protein 44 [Exaiptasia diaphana]
MSLLNANTMSMEEMKSKLLNYKAGDIHGVTSFRDADPDEMSDFHIRIGVFGPTGSGKSALINTVSKILRGAGEEVAISQSAGGEGTRVLDEITFGGFSMFDTRGFFDIESRLEETEFFRILYGSVRPGEEIDRGATGAQKTKSVGIAAHKLNKPPLKKQLHVVLWIIKGDDIRLITEQYQDKLNFILSKLRDEAITMVTVITHGDVISQMYNAEEFQENIRSQALQATKTCEDHAFVVQNWTENVDQLEEPAVKEVLKMILTALDCGERSVKMRQTKRKRLELQMKGERGIRSIWDEEHRPIHDEVLDFYLDPNRKTLGKFVPKPMPKATVRVRRTVGQKDTKTDRPKTFNQQQPLAHGVKKSHPLDDKTGYATGTEMLPREKNKNRDLPPAPLPTEPSKQSENLKKDDGMKPKLSGTSFMDVDKSSDHPKGQLQWIVFVLTGDKSWQEGDLASDSALQILSSINQLLVTVGFPSETEKIAVMSWRDRPYTTHQIKLKNLLARSQSAHKKPAKETPIAGRTTRDPNPSSAHRQQPRKAAREVPLAKMTEPTFDPVHGYLRYRAELEYGQVVKVLECYPPDWQPDTRDLHFIAGKNMTVPNALLEFWADSLDGPTKGPIVRTPKKSWVNVPRLPSLPKSWAPF